MNRAELAGLSPQLQQAAFAQAQQVRAQQVEEESTRIGNLLNTARIINLLTPETQQQRPITNLATVELKTFQGKTAPPGQVYTVALNPATGQFDNVIGTSPDPNAVRGENKVTPQSIESFTNNLRSQILTRIFFDEVRDGYEKEYGKDIANAGALLEALSAPFGGFDEQKALTYLDEGDKKAYNRILLKQIDRFKQDPLLNPEQAIADATREFLSVPPGTLGKSKIQVPGLTIQ